jgi:hypothetical protein
MGAAGLVRMACHQKTKDYVARRTTAGMRYLKRNVVR